MKEINQNLVRALGTALEAEERYKEYLEFAKNVGAEPCANCFEELVKDSEKAVQQLQELIEGHVVKGKWG